MRERKKERKKPETERGKKKKEEVRGTERERERKGVLERGKKQERKQKKVHTLEDIQGAVSQYPCVYNNNNIIISSVASKQQSDTSTTQAGAWCLLELLANKHSYVHYIGMLTLYY